MGFFFSFSSFARPFIHSFLFFIFSLWIFSFVHFCSDIFLKNHLNTSLSFPFFSFAWLYFLSFVLLLTRSFINFFSNLFFCLLSVLFFSIFKILREKYKKCWFSRSLLIFHSFIYSVFEICYCYIYSFFSYMAISILTSILFLAFHLSLWCCVFFCFFLRSLKSFHLPCQPSLLPVYFTLLYDGGRICNIRYWWKMNNWSLHVGVMRVYLNFYEE